MKLGTVMVMSMSAAVAAGCTGADGRPVEVSFGDGSATVSVRKVAVDLPAGTAVKMGAEMVSDLPEDYTFEASITSPRVFTLRLDNGDGTSHQIAMGAAGLEVTFTRGNVTRTEQVGFNDPAAFERWLSSHVADGSASCAALPTRFRDLPLEAVGEAIAADLSTLHGVALDLDRVRQVMCAAGVGNADSGVYGLPGFQGWLALQDPDYLGPDWNAELRDQARVRDANRPKNTCAKETVTIDQYSPVTVVSTSPTGNLDMACTDSTLHVDALCCQDETYDESFHGQLRKRGIDQFVACDHVTTAAGGPTKYAEWRFTGGVDACPGGAGTCTPNGAIDSVVSNHCTLSGYADASTPGFFDIGGPDPDSGDGVAASSILAFALYVCYEPGASVDTIHYHNRTITNFRGKLCNDTNLAECHCE